MPFTFFPIGQYVGGQTFVHRLDPRSKISFVLLYVVTLFAANTGYLLAVYGALAFASVWLSRLSVLYLWGGLKATFVLVVVFCFLQLAAVHTGPILWAWGWLKIYNEGINNAVFVCSRFVLVILMASLLTLTTPPTLLAHGLQALLRPFNRLGFPSHEFALMMTVAVRYIPAFLQELDKLTMTLTARGAYAESRNFVKRPQLLLRFVAPLFIFSFRRSEELALAMESRCYNIKKDRTNRKLLHAGWRDAVVGLAAFLLIIITLWFRNWD